MYRDIKKEYYFKVHIGEGQFGQVLLAERNNDNKMRTLNKKDLF